MKKIKIYEYEKELDFYLKNLVPISTGFDVDRNRYFEFNYHELRPLYIQTVNKIEVKNEN